MIEGLIGLIGITLGALLSAFGYFLKLREDNQKSKKMVLFYLLEIRHVTQIGYSTTPQKMYDDYINAWNNFLKIQGSSQNINLPNIYQDILKKHFEDMFNLKISTLNEKFLSDFEKALNNLAQFDPILAYQLKGNEILKNFLQVQNSYLQEVHNIIDNDSSISINSTTINNININEISKLLNTIDDDLRLISRKSGLITWWKCKKILKIKYFNENLFNPNDLQSIFEELANSKK